MRESFRLGRLGGVDIDVNWSVVLAFALVAIVLGTAQFPSQFPELDRGAYAAAGVATALLFLGSLIAHELAHALVARRYGLAVDGVTLWLFGGVTRLSGAPPDPAADLRVSAVGPLVSLGLAAGFAAVTGILAALGMPEVAVAVTAWLVALNLMLAAFNLVPAGPLDGGRILRALLWRGTGDRDRATHVAGRAGQAFAFLLVVLGLLAFVLLPGIGGLWIALLGGFLMTATGGEGRHERLHGSLEEFDVADVMTRKPLTVPDDLSIAAFLERYVFETAHSAFPIVEDGGRPTGLMTLDRIREVPPEERRSTPVAAVACPIEEVAVVSPREPASALVPRMTGSATGRALVVQEGRLVGMVCSRDLMRHLGPVSVPAERPAAPPVERPAAPPVERPAPAPLGRPAAAPERPAATGS